MQQHVTLRFLIPLKLISVGSQITFPIGDDLGLQRPDQATAGQTVDTRAIQCEAR